MTKKIQSDFFSRVLRSKVLTSSMNKMLIQRFHAEDPHVHEKTDQNY